MGLSEEWGRVGVGLSSHQRHTSLLLAGLLIVFCLRLWRSRACYNFKEAIQLAHKKAQKAHRLLMLKNNAKRLSE